MLSYILLAALLPAVILNYPIIPCGEGQPTPRELIIDGCPASPCVVTRGTLIPFISHLTANEDTQTLRLAIDLTAFGATQPFPVPPALEDVCQWLQGSTCPLTAGQLVTQVSSIPVITDFGGGIPITLRSRIYNGSGSMMSCSIINATVY